MSLPIRGAWAVIKWDHPQIGGKWLSGVARDEEVDVHRAAEGSRTGFSEQT
jgi:hypothetical protein